MSITRIDKPDHSISVDVVADPNGIYEPKGDLLAWIRQTFNTSPGKFSLRTKQRDPHNYGNKERRLYDTELFSCDTMEELLLELLIKANHMSKNIMYLNTPDGDVMYALDRASGGFSVKEIIYGSEEILEREP